MLSCDERKPYFENIFGLNDTCMYYRVVVVNTAFKTMWGLYAHRSFSIIVSNIICAIYILYVYIF